MADSLILMVLALVVFGPRRLPQIGCQIGKLMYEFRKASNDFKFQMEEELRNSEEAERRKKEEERLKALALNPPSSDAPAATDTGTAESPYPWESVYPSVPPPETTPDASASTDAPPADAAPTIQPPSTGETVPADAPATISTPVDQLTLEATSATPPKPRRRRKAPPKPATEPAIEATTEAPQEATTKPPEQTPIDPVNANG